jgi:hypothetical protein
MRTVRTLAILTLGVLLPVIAAGAATVTKAPLINYPALTGNETMPGATYHPTTPGMLLQSPGDTAGWTQYDYQTNGSTGNRVVVDAQRNVHFSWMNGNPYPSVRHVYYNCYDNTGSWIYPNVGTSVSYRSGDGYTNISSLPDAKAGVAYHNFATGAETLYYAVDVASCLATFDYFRPPNRTQGLVGAWPYITIQGNGNVHVTSTTQAGSIVLYTRSTDDGTTWASLQIADTSGSISQVITSSPVSNKVAIAYTRTNPDDMVATTSDIYYIESSDGLTWDWRNGRVNVTDYGPDTDSLSAGSDIDAIYDYNDNLHIVWNAHWVSGGFYYYLSWLYHYSQTPGNITEIIRSDSSWLDGGCATGGWNWHYCKMSIGSDTSSNIFVTYTDFDTSDCSLCGYANGDIYGHMSSNGGATWSNRVNITNSQTPGCDAGDCDSDNWSSLAEKVDEYLHLFYVNDKDAGGIPQTECQATDNPMLYYRVPVGILGIDEDTPAPRNFELSQNYPNPFNGSTVISFGLAEPGRVRLEVFDIKGSRVASLLDRPMDAGQHRIDWNADGLASGVYYYRLVIDGVGQTKQMVLLK